MDELDESIGQGDSKYHLEMREVDQIHNLCEGVNQRRPCKGMAKERER